MTEFERILGEIITLNATDLITINESEEGYPQYLTLDDEQFKLWYKFNAEGTVIDCGVERR